MFNQSLTRGLRPHLTHVSLVHTQSRGKAHVKDPFADIEKKDGDRILSFLKKYKLEKYAPKFNSWEHLMESHRLVLRHIIGVEATKERKRLRQVIQMKKVEEYFCENKVYIPQIQIGKKKFIHRASKTDDTNNTKFSDDDMSFRVPADDRNMSSIYTSMFYPNCTAKIELKEGAESVHQDLKETFLEGIITHSEDKHQLAADWDPKLSLLDTLLTHEDRRDLQFADLRVQQRMLDDEKRDKIDSLHLPFAKDPNSKTFLITVLELYRRKYTPEQICEIYAFANGNDVNLKPLSVEGNDGAFENRSTVNSAVGPLDIRVANTISNRVNEIINATHYYDLKTRFLAARGVTKGNVTPAEHQEFQAATQYLAQKFGQTSDKDIMAKYSEYIKETFNIPSIQPRASVKRKTTENLLIPGEDEITTTRLFMGIIEDSMKGENHRVGLAASTDALSVMNFINQQVGVALTPLSFDNHFVYHRVVREYIVYTIANFFAYFERVLDRTNHLATDPTYIKTLQTLISCIDADKEALTTQLKFKKDIYPDVQYVNGRIVRSSVADYIHSELDHLHAVNRYQLVLGKYDDVLLRETLSDVLKMCRSGFYNNELSDAPTGPAFLKDFKNTFQLEKFFASRRQFANLSKFEVDTINETHTAPEDKLLMLRTSMYKDIAIKDENHLEQLDVLNDDQVELSIIDDPFENTKIKLDEFEEEMEPPQTKPFKLDDYFSDLEEFRAAHPITDYHMQLHKAFLQGFHNEYLFEENPHLIPPPIQYSPGSGNFDTHLYHQEVKFLEPIAEYHTDRKLYIDKVAHERISEAQQDITKLIDQLEEMHIEASRLGKADSINTLVSEFNRK